MKDFTESLIVKNEEIIEFLNWAAVQPRGQNKVVLSITDVPEPRS